MKNENKLIEGFGEEWELFDQSKLTNDEHVRLFNNYFDILPKNFFNKQLVCADLGGGSGRWSEKIAKKIKKLYFVEPSKAINIAKIKLSKFKNIIFVRKKIENINLIKNNSLDFAFSLGVLHHTNNYLKALKVIRNKIKVGGFFLIYLYYNFDNKPRWFFYIWYFSNLLRKLISKLPLCGKKFVCDVIALLVYFPFAKLSKILELFKINTSLIPLSFYKNCSYYTMRTDAFDRFATIIENRFSRLEIIKILKENGFDQIKFSSNEPYWCALCRRKF